MHFICVNVSEISMFFLFLFLIIFCNNNSFNLNSLTKQSACRVAYDLEVGVYNMRRELFSYIITLASWGLVSTYL